MRTSDMKLSGILTLLFIALFAVSGCMGLGTSKKAEKDKKQEQPVTRKTTAIYYDFEDVLIPKELKVVEESTMVVSTPGYISGLMTFKGRVERRSLYNFFTNNMMKDNWRIVTQIKSPETTIMVFEKASRCSVITLKNKNFNTWVEIGVAPTIDDGSGVTESEIDF